MVNVGQDGVSRSSTQHVRRPGSGLTSASLIARDNHLRFLKLLHRGDARALASMLLSRGVDFGALGDFLVRGRLGVYAYAAITEQRLTALLPRALLDRLHDQHAAQARRNGELLEALGLIEREFRRIGIDLVVLKGLCFAERFWQGIDRRFTWDLDLLVRKRDIASAVDALNRIGLVKPKNVLGLDRLAPYVIHAFECKRLELSVDMHWTFRARPGIRFDMDAIWASLQPCCIGGIECRTLAEEYTLLQMLAGLASDIESSHCRMRSLWDVYLMLVGTPDMDWRGFLRRRQADGLTAVTVNALALVLHGLDCRAEFRDLSDAIDEYGDLLALRNGEEAMALLARPRHSLSNRAWFAGLLPISAWTYWLWWAGTIPLRFAFRRKL